MKSLSNRSFLFSQLATISVVSILLASILISFLFQPAHPFFATQTCMIFALIVFILPIGLFSSLKSNGYFYTPFFEIIIYSLAVAFIYAQNDYVLFPLLFFLGLIISNHTTSKYYIFMTEINHNELIEINSLDQFLITISAIIGSVIGGTLTYYQYFTALIFLVISLALLSWISHLKFTKKNILKTKPDLSLKWFKDIKESINTLKTKRDVFLCVLGISWILVIFTVFATEFIFTMNDTKKVISVLFFVIYLLGLSLGPLLCYQLLQKRIEATYVPLFMLAMTLFIVDLYFVTLPLKVELLNLRSNMTWRIAIDLFLLGICSGFATVPLNAIIQKNSDKTKTAEIIAAKYTIQASTILITLILILALEFLDLGITHFLGIIGIANLLVSLYICKLLPDIFFKTFFKTLLSIFYRVEIKGIENYEKAGEKTIIIANHTSYIDAMLFAAFLPDKLTFAINTYVAKRKWIRLFTRLVDTYPVNPLNPMAIKSLIEFIRKESKPIVIFPEGRVTVTGTLMKIYEGPGMIADKSGASLLPVRIQGAEFTFFSRLKGKLLIKWFPKITITILPPQHIDLPSELKGRKRRQKIGLKLYDIMTNMLFESSNYHRTLFTALLDAKELNGKKTIIMEDIEREPISYQQFIMRCFILGKMIAKNSRPGDIIGILLPNTNSNAITFFAMHAFSRVPAMLNFTTGIKNILTGCATAQIKLVYTARRFVEIAKLEELIAALHTNHINVVYLEDLRESVGFADKLTGFLLSQMPRFFYQRINSNKKSKSLLNSDKPAVILFTSGSEGTPKAVVLSHANLIANCLQVGACIDFTSSDRLFNALPLFHAFGLSIGMILPLTWGIKVFFYPSPLHFRIVPELVYDSNSTVFFGTDTFLKGYAKYAHPYDFYCVRFVFAGAEPLREETKRIWSQKFGIRILEGYGVTEASPVITANSAMHNKSGTVGRILPGIQYQLRPVPDYPEGGLLIVSGPNIMKGYLRADQPGKLIPPPDGWYDTGDVVKIDENGYVTIIGRMKRFAKIGGEMVSLTMIEQLLYQLWPEYQHAIINLPDPKKGEHVILATTHPEANRESIKLYFKENQLSELFIPKKILYFKNLPLLGSGKLDYAVLKKWVEINK